ncbi:MAG: hypothetical protein K0Q59_4876 [Paenibacillus sp.]|jgi:hypothetical protein|nr:hypothetical protein [Paenibacillus sp.]
MRGKMGLFAVYYNKVRLTKPGTEYEARMDLLRLRPIFLNLIVKECVAGKGTVKA